jgi:hypothetical protein
MPSVRTGTWDAAKGYNVLSTAVTVGSGSPSGTTSPWAVSTELMSVGLGRPVGRGVAGYAGGRPAGGG